MSLKLAFSQRGRGLLRRGRGLAVSRRLLDGRGSGIVVCRGPKPGRARRAATGAAQKFRRTAIRYASNSLVSPCTRSPAARQLLRTARPSVSAACSHAAKREAHSGLWGAAPRDASHKRYAKGHRGAHRSPMGCKVGDAKLDQSAQASNSNVARLAHPGSSDTKRPCRPACETAPCSVSHPQESA